LVCLLAVGCDGTIEQSAVDEHELPIIGGEVDRGDPSVVAIYGARPGSTEGFLCTGSVIAPTVVLTAAHCVAPSETGRDAKFVVLSGEDVGGGGTLRLPVRETHANPQWNPRDLQGGHDEGIVILTDPTSLPSLPIGRRALSEADVGEPVRIVGFGAIEGGATNGAGTKRQAMTKVASVSRDLLGIGDLERGTCNGDSGGPAFMAQDGIETIVGTTSFGDGSCADGGYDARVDVDLEFIGTFLGRGCQRTCADRSCGPDGYGGSCGSCSRGQTCAAGRCVVDDGSCLADGREREPNDSALRANRLCPASAIMGELAPDDEDWFTFHADPGASYDVRLAGTGAALRVYKRSATGRLSVIGDGPGLARHTSTGGTYYARVVSPAAASRHTSYHLGLHIVP
jgi:V8-like Glu-specific endopeptidase